MIEINFKTIKIISQKAEYTLKNVSCLLDAYLLLRHLSEFKHVRLLFSLRKPLKCTLCSHRSHLRPARQLQKALHLYISSTSLLASTIQLLRLVNCLKENYNIQIYIYIYKGTVHTKRRKFATAEVKYPRHSFRVSSFYRSIM